MQRESAKNVRPGTTAGNARSAGDGTGRWRAWVVAGLLFAAAGVGAADDGWRTWKSAAGTVIEAKLVSCDGKQATLQKKDGKQLTVNLAQLSAADQAFLKEQGGAQAGSQPKGETSIKGMAVEPGGPAAKITCEADPKWSYLLYLPKDFHTGRPWPVCFVMDPNGGNESTVEQYRAAVERLGIILAISCESRNEFEDAHVAVKAMVKDVYARLPVLEKGAIASGLSGGSRAAYFLAEGDKNVSGVLACASGAGVYPGKEPFRQARLRGDTIICSLIGTNDFNRCEAVKSHKGFGKEARLIWFAGSHQWAPLELMDEGLAEVYGRILEHSKARAAESLRPEFARKQLAWAKEQLANTPGTAYYWGGFLSRFLGDGTVQKEAGTLAASVANGSAYAKAEKTLQDFANKHFSSDAAHDADKEANPSRVKDAEKVAASLEGFPQAELVKRMGDPVPAP